MIKLTVEINVKNHEQLIASRKGAMAAKMAKMMPNSKDMVENEVKKEVLKSLQSALENELKNNGVEADVSVY